MTQQHLHHGDLDAIFQAVCGEAVTQRMDTTAIGQFGFGHRTVEDVLAGAFAHGLQGFAAREQEVFGPGVTIVVAEHAQHVVAQKRVALASALGMRNQQTMTCAIQVGDPNVGGFGKTQPPAIDATEEGAGTQVVLGADGQEFFDLRQAVRPRHASGPPGTLHLPEDGLDIPLEQSAIERAHSVDGQVDRGRGLLAFGN